MATDIQNLDGILQRFEDMASEPLENAMGKACALVERSSKQNAPKDTGALRNSIQSRIEKDSDGIVGIVFTPLEYAPYVEYGTGLFAEEGGRKTAWAYEDEKSGELIWTRGQQPQPFLRPALADNKEKITNMLKESIKK